MKLEKFATEVKNTTTELNINLQKNQIIITAEEVEFNDELEQVEADLQFIKNLEGQRVDELTVIVKEVA